MAGEEQLVVQSLQGIIPGMGDIVFYALVFGCLFFTTAVVGILLWLSFYKHKVLLYPVPGPGESRGRVNTIRCRRKIDDAGNHFWVALFYKEFGSQPAPEPHLRCSTKGKGDWASGFLVDGNMVWTLPDIHKKYTKEVPQKDKLGNVIKDENGKAVLKTERWTQLDLFTGTQRWSYQAAMKAAQKKAETWRTWAFPIIGMGFCLMALLINVIYFDTAAKVPIESQQQANVAIERLAYITEKQAEITGMLAKVIQEDQVEEPSPGGKLPSEAPG